MLDFYKTVRNGEDFQTDTEFLKVLIFLKNARENKHTKELIDTVLMEQYYLDISWDAIHWLESSTGEINSLFAAIWCFIFTSSYNECLKVAKTFDSSEYVMFFAKIILNVWYD